MLRLTDGKVPTARSFAVHVCDGWKEAVSDLCELQGALVRSWSEAAMEVKGVWEGPTFKMTLADYIRRTVSGRTDLTSEHLVRRGSLGSWAVCGLVIVAHCQ